MKKTRSQKQIRIRIALWGSFFGLLLLLGVSAFVVSIWYRTSFYMEFKELLYTMMSPLRGTGQSTVDLILQSCLPWVIGVLVIYVGILVFLTVKCHRFRLFRRLGAGFCAGFFIFSIVFSFFALRIPGYLKTINAKTRIYEEYYVDPLTVAITAEGKTKNLIYIYLESMEITYSSVADGGNQMHNYMPNLTALAKEHLSFSDSELLGGFHNPSGTSWTMGALLAMTSGIPFSLEIYGEESHNSMIRYESFAPKLTALGDILEQKGYRQEFLCGSDSAFAGRDSYFTQHGDYEIFDLYTAADEGYVPQGYDNGWWGLDDQLLFEIAKDELLELSRGDQPFNLTMLTVDAHHVNGYLCDACRRTYSNKLANVINCTDRLVKNFIEWCQQQEFYKDTVIVIAGDHPRMDTTLVKDVDIYDRTMYNCILNSDTEVQGSTVNRVFTCFDMFPTTLAAMGFEIEGDRLGLGTNLFSSRPTLAEERGYEWLNTEISKYSAYYAEHFT